MKLLLLALWRQLTTNRLATATSFVAIAIAIGAVVAVHMLSERLVAEVNEADPARVFGVSHWLREADLAESRYFELRRRWRDGEFVDIAALVPVVEGSVVSDERVYRLFAFDPLAVEGNAAGGAGGGADLLVADTVLVHTSTGLDAGATIRLGPDRLPVTVVGTFGEPGQEARWLVADIATGQRIFGKPGKLDAVGVLLRNDMTPWLRVVNAMFPGSVSRLGHGVPRQLDGMELTPAGDGDVSRFASAILFDLGALSALSALVAAFLVYQNALSHLRQRELLVDRLQAAGVPDGLVRAQLVLEGLVLALLAAGAGVAAGAIGARMLMGLVEGGVAPDAGADGASFVSGWAVVKAVFLAVGVGGAANVLAWNRLYSPRGPGLRVVATWVGAALLALGAWITAADVTGAFLAIGAACVLAVAGLAAWIRFGLATLLRRTQLGIFAVLNVRQALAALPSVNAALAALLLAVATAIGMGLMVQSFREAFLAALDQRLANDVVLEADAGFGLDTMSALAALDGVERLNSYIDVDVMDERSATLLVSVTSLDRFEAGRYGFDGDPAVGEVLLNEQAARIRGLRPGDELALTGPRGRTTMKIAHVFRDYGGVRPRVVVDHVDAGQLFDPLVPTRVGIKLAPGASGESLSTFALEHALSFETRERVRLAAIDTFERTFAISDALVLVALIVAVIGMGSAFTSLELTRSKEMRLLAVLGVDDARRIRMTLQQVGSLAAHVMLLSLPLGVVIGWVLCSWLNPVAFGWSIPLKLDLNAIVLPVVLGLLAALGAGILPTLRRGEASP